MMKTFFAAAAVAALSTPANALVVSTASAPSGNEVDTSLSVAGLLSADVNFNSFANAVSRVDLDVELEAGDVGPTLGFNSIVTNFGVENLREVTLSLDGATFSLIGSVVPLFSAGESLIGEDGDSVFSVIFGAPGESLGVEFGDTGFGGSDFGIDISGLAAGDSFRLTIEAAQAVPAPAAALLLLLGIGGLVSRQRFA
ncbi:MAG: PEP-CTERM sorting domain-containing protein [Pacificimonas sp.]